MSDPNQRAINHMMEHTDEEMGEVLNALYHADWDLDSSEYGNDLLSPDYGLGETMTVRVERRPENDDRLSIVVFITSDDGFSKIVTGIRTVDTEGAKNSMQSFMDAAHRIEAQR